MVNSGGRFEWAKQEEVGTDNVCGRCFKHR